MGSMKNRQDKIFPVQTKKLETYCGHGLNCMVRYVQVEENYLREKERKGRRLKYVLQGRIKRKE
jgi:hypothetical protein